MTTATMATKATGFLISLEGVTKEYELGKTRVNALKGIDLAIGEGEFLAVWGPSGSGKSSLLNLIGLLDTPTTGTVTLAGESMGRLGHNRLARIRNSMLGFVFQGFNLVPVLSALENVMLPLEIQGGKPRENRLRASELLEAVGLKDHAAKRPDLMSGGQRQRVAIARALVTRPKLVLADEPTANLDSETSAQIVSLMRDLNVRSRVTFVFSTHDPRLLDFVDRKVRLQDGRLAPQEP